MTEAPTSARARQLQRTKQALKQAALDLFAQRGYDATAVSDIATAAGVTERTFFRHFPTKDAVLFSESHERFEVLAAALAAHVDPAAPTWSAIRDALRSFAVDVQEIDERVDLISRLVINAPTLAIRLREHRALWQEWATEVLTHEGDRVRAALLAPVILAVVFRGQEIWVTSKGETALPDAMSVAIDDVRSALPEA